MKLLLFDDFKLGVLRGDGVVDVSDTVKDIPHTGPGDLMSGLIARFADYRKKIEDAAGRGKPVPVAQVRIRPPLPKPTNAQPLAASQRLERPFSTPVPSFTWSAPGETGQGPLSGPMPTTGHDPRPDVR